MHCLFFKRSLWILFLLLNCVSLLAQSTYYSRNGAALPRNWNEADSWTTSSDGSGPAAGIPGRNDNVVILNGHTVLINATNNNGFAGISPNGLGRANVGTFNGSGIAAFYQIGNITVNSGGVLSSAVRLMIGGSTLVLGTLATTTAYDDIINIGRLEISSGATFSCNDDFVLSGDSETLLFNTTTSSDDIYIDHTDAQLCGTGTVAITDAIWYFNGASSDQLCSQITITGCGTCPQSGTGISSLPTDQKFIYQGSAWRYLDDGSNQGTVWVGTSFNDFGWSTGQAQLGYGDGDETTTVSFGANTNNKHETTYFRKSFYVEDPNGYSSVLLRLLRDDGAVVYINGTEVDRQNMPAGTISFNTLASTAIGGSPEDQFFETSLNPSILSAGTNYIAVEVHQANVTSSDLSFDLELTGVFGNALINKGDTWNYMDDGSNQGTAWTGVLFNDASWSTGVAQLGYGDGDETTTISFGGNTNNKHETTYFRKSINVIDPSIYQSLTVNILRDDGVIIYVNGNEVLRNNMPTGTISFTTLASTTIEGTDEDNYLSFNVSSANLIAGTNVIAVEVHQANITSSDLSFDMELIGVESNVLPVELIHFSGYPFENKVELEWATASELNNDYFIIQHSDRGIHFTDRGIVKGNGTAYEQINYSYIDQQPNAAVNYYRLRQVDFDGQFSDSEIIRVLVNSNGFYKIYPNPVTDILRVVTSYDLTKANVALSFIDGTDQALEKEVDRQTLMIRTDQLAEGIYFLEVRLEEVVIRDRFLVVKN
ncbi:T9SS type A sorting domain-containing protein [Fulvivirga sp. M361]|uniref:T9SS type A sorting domain-containing protein n=1 Tax=Fulvivirga sp. M361 TaxID=2594266 RepID=UPI00117B8B36|nr:T9SS type A sorting domain-containing protein [Fulvivirga sp. M361]TRX51606.1 T9SS type A sorting domain-containing protein [Fulvivirga sp. M361]